MKIKSINNLTMFNDDQVIDLSEKLTIVFGYNGYGKSSISRLINSVSKTKLSNFNVKSLNALESDKPLEYEILDENGNSLKEIDAIVFNKDFVDSVIKKASFLENKINAGSRIVSDITFPEKELFDGVFGQLKDLNQAFEKEKETLNKMLLDEIANEKKIINASKFSTYSLDRFFRDYETIKTDVNQKEFLVARNKISSLGSIDEDTRIPNIKSASFSGLDDFKNILEYSEEVLKIELFDKLLTNEKEWILEGLEYIDEEVCPFCYQSIKEVEIVKSYRKFKESNISKKSELLKGIYATLLRETGEVNNSLGILENSVLTLKDAIEKSDDLVLKIVGTRQMVEQLEKVIRKLNDEKRNDIYKVITIDDIFFENVINIKSNVVEINEATIKINQTFEKTKQTLAKSKQECLEKFIFPSIKKKYLSQIENLRTSEENVITKKKEYDRVEKIYTEELKNRNPVMKEINETFESLGFEKYRVNNDFSLIHKKSKKEIDNTFTEKLSDGEKSLVAFALFYSQIKLKVYDEPKLIVIDDPVSSLDYENIYNIYYLIDDLVRNNGSEKYLICTHNHIYLNCLLYRRDNVKLLRIDKDDSNKSMLIESKSKLPNIYIDKLKEIKLISEKLVPSSHDKLIIPNFCRYVLETLAIFLFPSSVDSLKKLEDHIREFNKELKKSNQSSFINDKRLSVLFATINKGSHSTVEKVLDREDDSDAIYKKMCCDTIKIIKKYAEHQLDNLT